MKIKKEETIYKLFDENGNIEEETKTESIILVPETGKVIINKLTQEIIQGAVGVGTNDNINNYEEVIYGENR